jgi:hypothetical protein
MCVVICVCTPDPWHASAPGDIGDIVRGGPCCCREDRQQTKEQMNKALPLSSSHLSTESSANAPAWSHEATAFRTQWPAGRSEPGREQDKGPTCAPTCLHEATGRDLGTASSTPGASASSWMSMRMAGRFGPPLSTSDGPGRSHGTVSSRAAGETHAEITVEMRAARAAAPLGLGGLKDNSAIATGADGTGDVRAESSSLPVRTPKVGETNTPPLEQDEDLVQASAFPSHVRATSCRLANHFRHANQFPASCVMHTDALGVHRLPHLCVHVCACTYTYTDGRVAEDGQASLCAAIGR